MDAAADGRSPAPNFLWRRYSEFELLRSYLMVTYPYIVVPPLPEKRVSSDLNPVHSFSAGQIQIEQGRPMCLCAG